MLQVCIGFPGDTGFAISLSSLVMVAKNTDGTTAAFMCAKHDSMSKMLGIGQLMLHAARDHILLLEAPNR